MGFSSTRYLVLLLSLFSLGFVSTQSYAQELEIDVLGLFKNSAMLSIAGRETLLKTGERSKEGVLLVSADSKGAIIELAGERHELDLSSRIATSFQRPKESTVKILLNKSGQYKTRGSINGRSVEFLVDTGANVVAINGTMAASLGIDTSNAQSVPVTTASGVTESQLVVLDVVQIGNIRATNVRAAVIQGAFPVDILLGMTFLQNVKITESAGVMQLTGKF